MVIESDGGVFAVGCLIRCPEQGAQAGFGCADGGQDADETQHPIDPQPQAEALVQPVGQEQKQQGGKNDGNAD